MEKRKRLVVALAAVFSLSWACPGAPRSSAPFCAVAHAEDEAASVGIETDLGTPIPLRITVFSEEENGRWRFHHTAISCDDGGEDFVPLQSALESYDEVRADAADGEGQRNIVSLYVHRADNLVVSFAESRAMYGGGMRGRYAVLGENYDAATGEKLTFDDVFTGKGMVANEIAISLSRNYADAPFVTGSVPDLAARVQTLLDEGSCSWTLDPCGATFYFNMFSLSGDPYAPIYTATLTFDVNGFCFGEKYRLAPDRWCMEIEPRMPIRVSLGDSVLDTLEVRGTVEGVQILRGGAATTARDGIYEKAETVFTDPVGVNGIRPVFVKTRDGRKYLYVDCLLAPAPEDYEKGYDAQTMAALENRHELRVYDMNGDTPFRVACDGNFTMKREDIRNESLPKEWLVMTDPEDFRLAAAGASSAASQYRFRVGADGAPEVIEIIR